MTRAGWICLGLDAWLIGGSLLTLSWSLALAQAARIDGSSVAHTALSLAYPLLDIALVSMVLALHFRRAPGNRTAVNTAIGALALTVMCDALFTSPLLHSATAPGSCWTPAWFAGSLLLAYAPWAAPRRGSAQEARARRTGTRAWSTSTCRASGARATTRRCCPRRAASSAGTRPAAPLTGSLAALTPYLAAAVCTLGILYNVLNGRRPDHVVLITAGAVVLALVIRQGIMLLDNITLTQELAQKENHFRSLVRGSSDVIMIAAPNGILRYVSPAAAGVYGPARRGAGGHRAGRAHPPGGPGLCGARGAPLPRRQPAGGAHHAHRGAGSAPATAAGSTSSRPSTGTTAD